MTSYDRVFELREGTEKPKMLTPYTIAVLSCPILAPLVAHLRKGSPSALFAVAALVYLGFACTDVIAAQHALRQVQDADLASGTLYTVLPTGHFSVRIGVGLAAFAVVTWVQDRLGAMVYPRATKALFWLFHLTLVIGGTAPSLLGFYLGMPRRYVDYPAVFQTQTLIVSWAVNLSALAGVGLVGLLIWSCAQVLRARWFRSR